MSSVNMCVSYVNFVTILQFCVSQQIHEEVMNFENIGALEENPPQMKFPFHPFEETMLISPNTDLTKHQVTPTLGITENTVQNPTDETIISQELDLYCWWL